MNEHKLCAQSVNFDQKNLRRFKSQTYINQIQKSLDQKERFLDDRRKKLSSLLNKEEKQYHMEIIQGQETPEDVLRRMENELKLLKSKRLADKENNLQKIYEKRFNDSVDELRKNNSQATAVECYYEQENQMLDKMKRREKEKYEEMLYLKLNEFENLKQLQKEKNDAKLHDDKMKNIFDYQQWQRDQNEIAQKKINDINELENQRLKEQWKRDNDAELENEQKRKLMNIEVYKHIDEFNKKEEQERKRKLDLEKMQDKKLVDSILAKEKALDDIDKLEKQKKIKESQENRKYLEYIMNRKKEEEQWMDKIAQDEADRAYKKEQDEWLKQDNKRIQLLKDVYKGREDALLYKKKKAEEEKQKLIGERNELDKKMDEYYDYLEKISKEELAKKKAHQNMLLSQIYEKDVLRKKEMQDVKYEERAAQLWEQDYQNRINEQRELHLKRLKAIREKNAFGNNGDNFSTI